MRSRGPTVGPGGARARARGGQGWGQGGPGLGPGGPGWGQGGHGPPGPPLATGLSIVDVQSCSNGEMPWTSVFAVLIVRPNLELSACALSISNCRSSADSDNNPISSADFKLLTMLPETIAPRFPSSSALAITTSRKMQNRSGDNTQPCKEQFMNSCYYY